MILNFDRNSRRILKQLKRINGKLFLEQELTLSILMQKTKREGLQFMKNRKRNTGKKSKFIISK